ncbi:hypothetical protein D3873_03540 [Paenisporosarcina cavernae]|uniref:Uncharacterized protein n=1 Tax=Paenisporosarcina cavernae TaxID=2320858 RepID=A0A385YQG0_9BACL|nr:hypothetical protein D3873_03540 [Paenisporosarcina cavernae]
MPKCDKTRKFACQHAAGRGEFDGRGCRVFSAQEARLQLLPLVGKDFQLADPKTWISACRAAAGRGVLFGPGCRRLTLQSFLLRT